MECEFCKKEFSTKPNLIYHQKNAKYCLDIQGKQNTQFKCKYCDKIFTCQQRLNEHVLNVCKLKNKINYEQEIKRIQEEFSLYKKQEKVRLKDKEKQFEQKISDKERLIQEKNEYILKLEAAIEKFENTLLSMASERFNSINNEAVIEIDNNNEEKDFKEEEYQLQPLDLGNDLYIENREEDGYINVTNLCKAGNKKFSHWNLLDKTKTFLRVLSSEAGIPASLLIIHQTGSGSNQCTWVHPYIAINIAQWISPQFDVKVSSWIYEVMLTGKIDISKTKSFQQLRLENKEHKLKIQYLTKKYVKSQPRIQYNEKNVIYILTTPSHKKEGKYILGKATNLTNRLSTYNKTDEHEVIYYQECPDEDSMSIVEQVVFHKLKDYREQANRERFILPEEKSIELFIDTIKKSIETFQK